MSDVEAKGKTNEDNTYALCNFCTHNVDGNCMVWHMKVNVIQATTCKHFNGFIK